MTYIRTVKRENPFVQIDKSYIGGGKMSLKATGLLTYFLSKPDGWKIRLSDVQKQFTDGRDSIRSALNELRDNFYVNRYRERKSDGTFGDYVYEVFERPEYNPMFQAKEFSIPPKTDFPTQEKPTQEKPTLDNPTHINIDSINNDSINNEFINIYNHHLEKMGTKQKDLFVKFLVKNREKIDDDLIHALADRILKYKPNSMKYIKSIYESIINEQKNNVVTTKNNRTERLPKWMTDPEWMKTDESDEDIKKRVKNLEEFLDNL